MLQHKIVAEKLITQHLWEWLQVDVAVISTTHYVSVTTMGTYILLAMIIFCKFPVVRKFSLSQTDVVVQQATHNYKIKVSYGISVYNILSLGTG